MKHFLLTVLTLSLIIILGGCLNPFAPPLENPTSPRRRVESATSPEILLNNLKISIEQTDLNLYLDCLDDDFKFKYWDDSLNHYNIWGYATEKDRMTSMFEYFETITFDSWNVVTSTRNNDTYIRKVWFEMDVFDFDSGIERVVTGYAYFEIEKNKNSDLFRITLWKDESES